MKTLLATGAALGLIMAAAPVTAQTAMDDSMATATSTELSTTQQTAYDGWPADRQTTYDAWPAEAQSYFWTLNQDQMRGWWALNDEQRVRIVGMAPEQRTAAWTSILSQLTGAAPASATSSASAAAMPGPASARTTTAPRNSAASRNIEFRSTERVQATPNDQGPPDGEVPVCSANEQDNCINAWESGKRGPGVNRPLETWPGRPASEM